MSSQSLKKQEPKKSFSKAQHHYSEVKDYWENFKNQNTIWLQNFCRWKGISEDDIPKSIQKQNKNFAKLQQMINGTESGDKNGSKFYKNFARLRKKSYLTFKVTFQNFTDRIKQKMQNLSNISGKSSQRSSSENLIIYRRRYQNYNAITKLLSNERYQFKYIAKHYFAQTTEIPKYSSQPGAFIFQVEKGIPFTKEGDRKGIQSEQQRISKRQNDESRLICDIKKPIIYYMMIRDIAKAIIELEKRQIVHMDLARRNFVCICKSQKDLINIEDSAKWKDVTFKLIDFEDAFVMSKGKKGIDGALYKNTQIIFKEIEEDPTEKLKFMNTCFFQNNLKEVLTVKDRYKQVHLNQFKGIVRTFESDFIKPSSKEIICKLQNSTYEDFILFMDTAIEQQIGK